jgi:hypothetical protein
MNYKGKIWNLFWSGRLRLTRGTICPTILVLLIFGNNAASQSIFEESRKHVAFLAIIDSTGKTHGDGTCFFVNSEKTSKDYLVLARHSLIADTACRYKSYVVVVLNRRIGPPKAVRVYLFEDGRPTFSLFRRDTTADVAVIHCGLDTSEFDVTPVASGQLLSSRATMDSLRLGVGTDLHLAGLLPEYPGVMRLQPVVRFGRIALLPQEEFTIFDSNLPCVRNRSAILLDLKSIPGFSGAPVFAIPAPAEGRDPSVRPILVGMSVAGVGQVHQYLGPSSTATDNLVRKPPDTGFSYIVPSYVISRIIDSLDAIR